MVEHHGECQKSKFKLSPSVADFLYQHLRRLVAVEYRAAAGHHRSDKVREVLLYRMLSSTHYESLTCAESAGQAGSLAF